MQKHAYYYDALEFIAIVLILLVLIGWFQCKLLLRSSEALTHQCARSRTAPFFYSRRRVSWPYVNQGTNGVKETLCICASTLACTPRKNPFASAGFKLLRQSGSAFLSPALNCKLDRPRAVVSFFLCGAPKMASAEIYACKEENAFKQNYSNSRFT